MQNRLKAYATILAATASLTVGACGRSSNDNTGNTSTAAGDVAPAATPSDSLNSPAAAPMASTDSTTPQHHSKLKGALVGAAAGHFLGHHALVGAAAGALVQHERNKHP